MDKVHSKTKNRQLKNSKRKTFSFLLRPLNAKAGRSAGKISVRRRCGGTKKQYRLVDFRRNKSDVTGKITQIDYDPNRSANIALVKYVDGDWSYIIAANDMKIGQDVIAGQQVPISTGNRMCLKNIPLGTEVYNIELIEMINIFTLNYHQLKFVKYLGGVGLVLEKYQIPNTIPVKIIKQDF